MNKNVKMVNLVLFLPRYSKRLHMCGFPENMVEIQPQEHVCLLTLSKRGYEKEDFILLTERHIFGVELQHFP